MPVPEKRENLIHTMAMNLAAELEEAAESKADRSGLTRHLLKGPMHQPANNDELVLLRDSLNRQLQYGLYITCMYTLYPNGYMVDVICVN